MEIPRGEYPRPQFVRPDWLCLNGVWEFEIDQGDSGLERGLTDRALAQRILVPFCPESTLSGIGNTDFLNAVWYRRQVQIPADWSGRHVLLHFQAVDYDATVWVNGREVARHRGGWCGFSCDLHGIAEPGQTATIVVRARDDARNAQPLGKQAACYANSGCNYTRTTGIWQTVWMEPVPELFLQRPRLTPDLANGRLQLEQAIGGNRRGRAHLTLRATLRDPQGVVCAATVAASQDFSPRLDLPIPASRRRLWSPGDPFLYDLHIELLDIEGNVIDRADSYAGLRSVTRDGCAIKINGQAIFQRLVLDQGYYPDGILTAASDEELVRDIKLSLAAGFNGARLHQKVFEERFLYHADRLGYLCWGEFGDWGANCHGPEGNNQQPGASFITQWLEVLQRDYSHPAIIGWCPLNETWQVMTDRITVLDDVTHGMFLATKAMDQTRPVLDASGYSHRVADSDVYDNHDYEPDPDRFRRQQDGLLEDKPFINTGTGNKPYSIGYRGQPFFCSEFGGIRWNTATRSGADSWGYGREPRTLEEFYERFEGLCAALLDNPRMFAYCYTQLTDVFQEQNGIYHFDRTAKFDLTRIRAAQQRPAAMEKAVSGT
jgi:beta-galactosidase/beta-glucuronidase